MSKQKNEKFIINILHIMTPETNQQVNLFFTAFFIISCLQLFFFQFSQNRNQLLQNSRYCYNIHTIQYPSTPYLFDSFALLIYLFMMRQYFQITRYICFGFDLKILCQMQPFSSAHCSGISMPLVMYFRPIVFIDKIIFSSILQISQLNIMIIIICMKILIFLLSFLLATGLSQTPPQNPVIGIFTQTHTDTATSKSSYIAASYVKFIQMSGAQVVPIYSFSDTDKVLALLKKINGVLFPGGGMEFSLTNQWTKNADAILKYAKEQNDLGNPFPVFGTCLGIQLLSFLTSNYNSSILTRVHGHQAIVAPITFVNDGYLFHTYSAIQTQKITKGHGIFYFNHNWAVSLDTFNSNINLKNFWNLIATGVTPQNEKFVASFEAKKYPFYGVQFHPEKNMFEWKVFADRSLEGVEVVQILSNRFIEVARRNKNSFASADEFTKASIYNFHTQPTTMSFTQIYVFNEVPREVEIIQQIQ